MKSLEPLGQDVGTEEGAVYPLGRGLQDSVQAEGVAAQRLLPQIPTNLARRVRIMARSLQQR